ncbi:MAG: MFS transporter [Promethearchaeota archaeon]|nr:MAG: MFS transporter [Candidatus Lokiarchaeota archaeon]
MSKKLSTKETLSIYLIGFGGQLAWAVENQFYNVFLYNEIAPVPLYVSLMVMITAVVSTVTTIIMGAVSDVKGKRRSYMIFGFACWIFTTALFPFAAFIRPVIMAVVTAILFDSIMTYFGATAYDANFNAYVTDITTLENRGKALGIMEIMTLLATLIVYGGSGFIIAAFGYYFFFIMIGIVTGAVGITGALLARDADNLNPLNTTIKKHLKSTFNRDNLRGNREFFLVLAAIGTWAVGFNVYFPFILIYLQHHIGLSIELAALVIFISLMISIILGIPMGTLTDKVGRKKVAFMAIICQSISLILFALTEELLYLIITGILWVLFMTMFRISSRTWIKDHYPEEKYGQFSGYFLFADVLVGMTVGPLIGGIIATQYGRPIVVDGIPGTVPPPLVFIVAAFIILIALIPIVMAKDLRQNIEQ